MQYLCKQMKVFYTLYLLYFYNEQWFLWTTSENITKSSSAAWTSACVAKPKSSASYSWWRHFLSENISLGFRKLQFISCSIDSNKPSQYPEGSYPISTLRVKTPLFSLYVLIAFAAIFITSSRILTLTDLNFFYIK